MEKVRRQTLWLQKLPVAVQDDIAILRCARVDFFAIEEAVVQVAKVASFFRDSDLLGKACTQGVRARNDDAIRNAQFEKRVTAGTNFLQKIFVRDGHFAILVATLFLVRNLIFYLQGTCARFDHLFGQKIGRLGIAETCVNVRDDRHDVGFMVFDFGKRLRFLGRVISCTGVIKVLEEQVELTAVRLTQECVEFTDKGRDACLFMH